MWHSAASTAFIPARSSGELGGTSPISKDTWWREIRILFIDWIQQFVGNSSDGKTHSTFERLVLVRRNGTLRNFERLGKLRDGAFK